MPGNPLASIAERQRTCADSIPSPVQTRLGGVEGEPAEGHPEQAEQDPFGVAEQLVAPVHRGQQRPMAGESAARSTGEHPEPVGQPVGYLQNWQSALGVNGLAPHRPHRRRVLAEGDLPGADESVALVERAIALAGGFQIRGHGLGVAPVEHRP